jgi:hypothetical protein
MAKVIPLALLSLAASEAAAQEQTLGALISGGQVITQLTLAEIDDDKAHLILLLEGDKGGFLCKVEALLERDKLAALGKPGSNPDILGLKTSDAAKWRTCAQIY